MSKLYVHVCLCLSPKGTQRTDRNEVMEEKIKACMEVKQEIVEVV